MNTFDKSRNMELSFDAWNAILSVVKNIKSSTVTALETEKKGNFYVLRSDIYTAKTQHFCRCCMQYIQPGQKYEKIVQVINSKIFEFKSHHDPACDFPDDPVERYGAGYVEESMTQQQAA